MIDRVRCCCGQPLAVACLCVLSSVSCTPIWRVFPSAASVFSGGMRLFGAKLTLAKVLLFFDD